MRTLMSNKEGKHIQICTQYGKLTPAKARNGGSVRSVVASFLTGALACRPFYQVWRGIAPYKKLVGHYPAGYVTHKDVVVEPMAACALLFAQVPNRNNLGGRWHAGWAGIGWGLFGVPCQSFLHRRFGKIYKQCAG